ncbi:MAG: hypothetical protein J5950_05470, partial [Clostridia bacterium]|nr:hypothetical protein [Clostridia bacterium]
MKKRKLRWMRLDNAALIFPASLRKGWSNAYRISFSFIDPVDPEILQNALDRIATRFPSVCVKLCRGLFWYYLEELQSAPKVLPDSSRPLVGMTRKSIKECAIRVLYYDDRMAVEYFHSVTDGTGAMVFAKNLAAEYVRQRYGAAVPFECDLKDPDAPVPESELKDCFAENTGNVSAPRDSRNVYRLGGTREPDDFLHVTLGIVSSQQLVENAKKAGVTVTAYLTAFVVHSILKI